MSYPSPADEALNIWVSGPVTVEPQTEDDLIAAELRTPPVWDASCIDEVPTWASWLIQGGSTLFEIIRSACRPRLRVTSASLDHEGLGNLVRLFKLLAECDGAAGVAEAEPA